MNDLSTITAWMEAQIGTAENPKGSNNVIYNTHYYGHEVFGDAYPWCVAFLWAGFNACSLSRLFMGGGKTASVAAVVNYAQRHGQWVTGDYKPGDILCYGTEHIGFCVSSDGWNCTAIEGNYGDRVARVRRNGNEITGAFRPLYAVDDTTETPHEETPVEPQPATPDYEFKPGDVVAIAPGAVYWGGSRVPNWVQQQNWIIRSVHKTRAVIDRNEAQNRRIMSAIDVKYLELVKTAAESVVESVSITEYTVQPGDTLWSIAQRFLGNGFKWEIIQAENNIKGTAIFPGQVLKIPKNY